TAAPARRGTLPLPASRGLPPSAGVKNFLRIRSPCGQRRFLLWSADRDWLVFAGMAAPTYACADDLVVPLGPGTDAPGPVRHDRRPKGWTRCRGAVPEPCMNLPAGDPEGVDAPKSPRPVLPETLIQSLPL